jgi:predicted acetyltransferase/uncharacterized protein YndB with AHSA1/START domain
VTPDSEWPEAAGIELRLPREDEEEEFLRAHRATSPGYPNFLHFYRDELPFGRYLRILEEQAQGIGVSPSYVPSTVLFAFEGERIVGRVAIRHRLTPYLEKVAGHVGYVVVPEFRGRGHAGAMLRLTLRIARDELGISRVLITCDEDNVASIRTVEKCGGVFLETVSEPSLEKPRRRYAIEAPAPGTSAGVDSASAEAAGVGSSFGDGTPGASQRGLDMPTRSEEMPSVTKVGAMTFTKPDDISLVAERIMDAPRELVWAAHTRCEHVRQWLLGPEGWTMPSCEIDLRPGGEWLYVYRDRDGEAGFSMRGEYREIKAPERIVNTERMDDNPVETVNTLTLEDQGGRTFVRTVVEYPSEEIREQIIATGMLGGWAESYERLEAYLQEV